MRIPKVKVWIPRGADPTTMFDIPLSIEQMWQDTVNTESLMLGSSKCKLQKFHVKGTEKVKSVKVIMEKEKCTLEIRKKLIIGR